MQDAQSRENTDVTLVLIASSDQVGTLGITFLSFQHYKGVEDSKWRVKGLLPMCPLKLVDVEPASGLVDFSSVCPTRLGR